MRLSKMVYRADRIKSDTGGKGMENTSTIITAVKYEMQLRGWTAQIEAQLASGMTVQGAALRTGSVQRPITTACGKFVSNVYHLHRQSCH